MKFYLNGTLRQTTTQTSGCDSLRWNDTKSLDLMCLLNVSLVPNYFGYGELGVFRLYENIISPARILQLYNQDKARFGL